MIEILKSTKVIGSYIQMLQCFRGDCEYVINKGEANDLARNIMSGYGGMASFGGFVLYTNGKYLPEPAEKFSKLKTQLFNSCVDIITRPCGSQS